MRTVTYDERTHKIAPIKAQPMQSHCVIDWNRGKEVHIPIGKEYFIGGAIYELMVAAAPPYPEDSVWIPCSERLPEPYTEVMVWPYPSDYCMTAEFSSDRSNRKGWCYSEYITGFGNERIFTDRITHWMPLPAAPKGE